MGVGFSEASPAQGMKALDCVQQTAFQSFGESHLSSPLSMAHVHHADLELAGKIRGACCGAVSQI